MRYRSPSRLILAASKSPKRFSGGKASLMRVCGLGIRKASQSQRRSQELAAALAAGQLCPLSLSACSETITRPPIRYVAHRGLACSRPIAVPRARLRTFHLSNLESHSTKGTLTRKSLDKQSRLLTNPTVSQSSPLRLCSLACLGPLPCSPFLATIIGEYTLSRYILGRSHVSPRACGWTFASAAPTLVVRPFVQ